MKCIIHTVASMGEKMITKSFMLQNNSPMVSPVQLKLLSFVFVCELDLTALELFFLFSARALMCLQRVNNVY